MVGRGGMGEVWRAEHVLHGRGVAVKLLTAEAARDPKYRLAFRNEVRNAAQLDHPNLVEVYDYGEVTDAESAASGGRFEPGTPWLVMEFVDGETLLPYCGGCDWTHLREVTKGLLDALAHVHARGVYHRDLKPANVMLTSQRGRLQVKLSDFGLAHASEATEEDHFNGGTPAYMAPEQFDGMWRNYGPWTDLYGLGCLLFALSTGTPPFGVSRSFEESRRLHLEAVVPALDPPYPVPAGFESWLRRLLEKDPARRYRRAADAARDFLALGSPVGTPSGPLPSRSDLETLRLQTLSTQTHVDVPVEEVQFTVGSSISRPPPLPDDWRQTEVPQEEQSVRAGLSLLGLRAFPLVGRDKERDRLWAALRRAREHGRVEVVALHGDSGTGKSRLADWLGQRAHEVGSGILMRATHSERLSSTDGLGGMAVRFLRCEGLSRVQLQARVTALVGEAHEEGEALLELLSPGLGGVRFGSIDERHFAVEQLLFRATTERPVILRLDDVHYGPDTLRFVRRLLERDVQRPIVVVLTATAITLQGRVDAGALWEELIEHRRVDLVHVGTLGPRERRVVVQTLLGLEPALASAVEATTEGNPQFILQLVKHWVDRNLLQAGRRGFTFRPGVQSSLPSTLSELWSQRAAHVLESLGDQDARTLEVGAVLGRSVDPELWSDASQILGVTPSLDLMEVLLHAGVIRGDEVTGWTFGHPALVQALVERARAGGRLQDCHRTCAILLAQQPQHDPGELGRHLLGAGEALAALEPLLQGLQHRVTTGDYQLSSELLSARQEALKLAAIPANDPRWGESDLAFLMLTIRQGARSEARQILDVLQARAEEHGWVVIEVSCRIQRARMDRLVGRMDDVVRSLRNALEEAVAVGEQRLVAQARVELGDVEAVRGQLDLARHWARAALNDYERLGDFQGQARCWQSLGELDRESGDYVNARQLLERARLLYERSGYRWGMASVLNSEGDVARHLGDMDHAETCYRRSIALFRAIGSHSAVYPEYNHALTLLARGEVAEAQPTIERGMEHFSRLQDSVGLANAHLAMALCSAVGGQWLAWDDHLREGLEAVARINAADEDTAWIAQVAGRQAALGGEVDRALRAYGLALDTWRVLERHERSAEVEDALAALGQ